MKRNQQIFLFAAWMVWGATPISFAQPNQVTFDGKFYSGTIAAPNRYDISVAGDGSILMDISNDALFLNIEYHFLKVSQFYSNDRVALATDNTGDGLWSNSVERAFTSYAGGMAWNSSYSYYSNDCELVNFQPNADGAGSGFDENGKAWVKTRFYITSAGNAIPFPRRIFPHGQMGGWLADKFDYQFPASAQFCDPSSWPEFVLATVSGVGPVYYYAHQIFEVGSEARGDGDGRAESGERLELSVKLINMGDQTAELTTAILQTPSSPYVAIVDSSNYWENISGGEIKDNLGSFVFDINPNLLFDTAVNLKLKVSAIGGDWMSTLRIPIFVQDNPPFVLNPPTNLVARLQSDNASVELTWQDNSSGEEGFKIERRTGASGNWVEIATAGADAQNYTDTNLPPETYSYRVRAFKGTTYSDYSNVYSVIIFAKPAPPQNLRATAGFKQITLTWDPNSEGDILRYRIYGGTAAHPTTAIDSVEGVNNTSKIIAGLTTGVKYYFRLIALSTSLQQSDYSNEVSAAPELFTESTVNLQTTFPAYFAVWGDYDNDYDLDILISNQIYRNDNNTFGNTVINLPGYGGNMAWGDYDRDGDLDILSGGFIYRNDNGNFVDLGVKLTGSNGYVAWGDYDNDGDLDILVSTRIYRNDAGVFNDIGIRLFSARAWGDYDNDGDLDILDQHKIYRNDGGSFADIGATLSFTQAWGDYDSDGDLDVLAAAKIYRNDNGSFVDINATLPAGIGFNASWGDYDNDGDLDVLLSGAPEGTSSGISKVYRNDNGNFVDSGIPLVGLTTAAIAWGDSDHDGDLDILLSGTPGFGYTTKIYRNNSGTQNTAPTPPNNLTAVTTGHAVALHWNKSTDNETAQNGLTYNLRVGKTPGGGEVMSPMAEAGSGIRRLAQLGNANQNTSWTLKNLAPGKYYWSVQAIDNAFAGSAFASEQSFVINEPALKPEVQPVQAVGAEFWVDLAISDVQNLFGLSLELNYTNTQFLDVVTPTSNSVVPGAFLGTDVVFISNVDETAGKVNIGVSRKAGQDGINGSGFIARVKFNSTAATPTGTTVTFSVSNVIANDPSGTAILLQLASATVTLNLNDVIVWPGDANNDKLVNQTDVLPIGLHWNKTGPARQNPATTWTPQVATAWAPAAATYADGNGDGLVNQSDVLPIGLNWGKTHSATLAASKASEDLALRKVTTATLSTAVVGSTNPGQDFYIEVRVDNVASLFGLAFELLYSPTTYLAAQSAEAGNFLGNDVVFFPNIDPALGKVSVGITCKAGQSGVNGSGVVARIQMRSLSTAPLGAVTQIKLQNPAANDSTGQAITLNVVNQPLVTEVAQQNASNVPVVFALHPNVPNPFNPATMIHYDLAATGEVTVEIFDMLGKHVRTLVQQSQTAGQYSVAWNGRDENGKTVASGVFICQLRVANSGPGGAGNFVQNRKMLFIQ